MLGPLGPPHWSSHSYKGPVTCQRVNDIAADEKITWPDSCNLNNNSADSINMFLSQVTNISFWFFFSTWSNGVHSWWWPVWDIFFVSNIFFLFQIFFSMWSNGVHSSWWPVGDLGQCSHNLPPHCWLTGTLSEITNRHEPTNTKTCKNNTYTRK